MYRNTPEAGFYTLPANQRKQIVSSIAEELLKEIQKPDSSPPESFSFPDTYIRKAAYQAFGKFWTSNEMERQNLVGILFTWFDSENELIRQTVINAAGEIACHEFEVVVPLFEKGLHDRSHKVRNAVIGSLKKSIARKPHQGLKWASKFIIHPDAEIRREICHGIELRGRTHPQEVLPLLKLLQYEKKARVRNMLIHVIGQISYKKNCLTTVLAELEKWENRELVTNALTEIADVHERYSDFAFLSPQEAGKLIDVSIKKIQGT